MVIISEYFGYVLWIVSTKEAPDVTVVSSIRFPLIFSARKAQMGRPRRSPSAMSHCDENAVNRVSRSASGMPGPESVTINWLTFAPRFL